MNCLILFAKAPRPGKVKTRMIDALGELRACELHWSLVNRMVDEVLTSLASTNEIFEPLALQLYTDDVLSEEVLSMAKAYSLELFEQSGADLGEKMLRAFENALREHDRVVLCGSDSLDLQASHCDELIRELDNVDIAIAPAVDGGYIAIAAKQVSAIREVMQNIDWGTDQVFSQTQRRAVASGLTVSAIAPLSDIDHPEDLLVTRYADWLHTK